MPVQPKTLLQLMKELGIEFHDESVKEEPGRPPGPGRDASKGWIQGRSAYMTSTFWYQGRTFTTTYVWFKGPVMVSYEPQNEEEYAELNLAFLLDDAKDFQEFWKKYHPKAFSYWLRFPHSDSDTYRERLLILWEMRKLFREDLQLLMNAPLSKDYYKQPEKDEADARDKSPEEE